MRSFTFSRDHTVIVNTPKGQANIAYKKDFKATPESDAGRYDNVPEAHIESILASGAAVENGGRAAKK